MGVEKYFYNHGLCFGHVYLVSIGFDAIFNPIKQDNIVTRFSCSSYRILFSAWTHYVIGMLKHSDIFAQSALCNFGG